MDTTMKNKYPKHLSALLLLVALQSVHADNQSGSGINVEPLPVKNASKT
jgi:hypothetical protein